RAAVRQEVGGADEVPARHEARSQGDDARHDPDGDRGDLHGVYRGVRLRHLAPLGLGRHGRRGGIRLRARDRVLDLARVLRAHAVPRGRLGRQALGAVRDQRGARLPQPAARRAGHPVPALGGTVKTIATLALLASCGLASAQSADELLNAGKNPENVTNFGMGYHLNMWSPLKQIDKSNVKRLVPVWSFSLMNEVGEHSQPTIYNGVMYVVNGNWTFAIDLATGRQIWRTPVQYERGALRVATSGALMRGAATIYQGKLFRQTVDAHVMALDMKTGKEIWKTKYADYKEGYKGVIAPMIANGVLISGMGGGDSTTRGFVDGYDPETGKQLWRRYTIPAPGEPGSETWPNATKPDAWKYGGGATWQSASYDPQLDLIFIGTGNAEPYNPTFRDGQDCLYTASILALR